MKKILSIVLLSLMFVQTAVMATPEPAKIAVVDLNKVVEASPQVKAIKAAQEAKSKEIANFVKNAQADVNKQKDEKAKKAAADKYEKQFASKREANMKDYAAKIKAADKSITEQIGKKATEMGYTMVLPKSSVVYGGDDITAEVLKVIK